MAVHRFPSKVERANAVMEKLARLFESFDFATDATIVIEMHEGEFPTIKYNVYEHIIVGEKQGAKGADNDK